MQLYTKPPSSLMFFNVRTLLKHSLLCHQFFMCAHWCIHSEVIHLSEACIRWTAHLLPFIVLRSSKKTDCRKLLAEKGEGSQALPNYCSRLRFWLCLVFTVVVSRKILAVYYVLCWITLAVLTVVETFRLMIDLTEEQGAAQQRRAGGWRWSSRAEELMRAGKEKRMNTH